MNQLNNDQAVYRTAPATPGLLITRIYSPAQSELMQRALTSGQKPCLGLACREQSIKIEI